ncbi:MAG: YdcF family protein [Actinomycetota bacterium]
MGHRTRRRTGSWLGTTVAVVLLAGLGYLALTAAQVWWSARTDSPAEADAIVVLGAAQYDGHPSAALQGRLDHAAWLYEAGRAPRIVVTGGSREGDRFTEAEAGALYLHASGVPGEAIERETTGASTFTSLASVARYLRPEGVTSVIVVSDPFHSHRAKAIAREVGFEASASASTTSPFQGTAGLVQWARETAAVAVGRLIGYRRLESLGFRLDALQAGLGVAASEPYAVLPAPDR